MTSYTGQPSKWAWASLMRWRKHLSTVGCHDDHVLQSVQADSSVEPWKRFLPSTSMSSVGIVSCLVGWTSGDVQKGGLRDQLPRDAARLLLNGFINAGLRVRGWNLLVRFDQSWTCPLPAPDIKADIVLRVSQDGLDDLTSWKTCFAQGLHSETWLTWLKLILTTEELATLAHMPLITILMRTRCNHELQSLHNQLVWQVGVELERTITLSLELGCHKDGLDVKPMSITDHLAKPHRLDRFLLRHVLAGVAYGEGKRTTSMCVDKANVCMMNLQGGVIVYPVGNACTILCPQASPRRR